ncbi:MAG: hypothetical protein NTX91_03335 [candidate division SR1 bacterium]|nr:hypothetical protein [candidate division SR1 bacterium]
MKEASFGDGTGSNSLGCIARVDMEAPAGFATEYSVVSRPVNGKKTKKTSGKKLLLVTELDSIRLVV